MHWYWMSPASHSSRVWWVWPGTGGWTGSGLSSPGSAPGRGARPAWTGTALGRWCSAALWTPHSRSSRGCSQTGAKMYLQYHLTKYLHTMIAEKLRDHKIDMRDNEIWDRDRGYDYGLTDRRTPVVPQLLLRVKNELGNQRNKYLLKLTGILTLKFEDIPLEIKLQSSSSLHSLQSGYPRALNRVQYMQVSRWWLMFGGSRSFFREKIRQIFRCPPYLQWSSWHFLEQYATRWHSPHLFKLVFPKHFEHSHSAVPRQDHWSLLTQLAHSDGAFKHLLKDLLGLFCFWIARYCGSFSVSCSSEMFLPANTCILPLAVTNVCLCSMVFWKY